MIHSIHQLEEIPGGSTGTSFILVVAFFDELIRRIKNNNNIICTLRKRNGRQGEWAQ